GRLVVGCHEAATGRIRLTVADTGAGIPGERRARLFTPFDRLGAETSPVEGTGLGLALSHRLVEAMGGTIGLDDAEGGGSLFWIELAETASPAVRAGLATVPAPAAEGRRLRGTILYVEDNPSNLRLVERGLAEQTARCRRHDGAWPRRREDPDRRRRAGERGAARAAAAARGLPAAGQHDRLADGARALSQPAARSDPARPHDAACRRLRGAGPAARRDPRDRLRAGPRPHGRRDAGGAPEGARDGRPRFPHQAVRDVRGAAPHQQSP